MTGNSPPSQADVPIVTRLAEDEWPVWRAVRLAALADAPASFAPPPGNPEDVTEAAWRDMIREAAIFVAAVSGTPAGVAAGLRRPVAAERGLGAMWVAPPWRGRGVAAQLADAVIGWARAEGAARLGLWAPADSARARRFYERHGFRATGQRRPFPSAPGRSIIEMSLRLA